jgi:hypothetical protein
VEEGFVNRAEWDRVRKATQKWHGYIKKASALIQRGVPETDVEYKKLVEQGTEIAPTTETKDPIINNMLKGWEGQDLYRYLANTVARRKVGEKKYYNEYSQKEASLFLLRAGIDGIRYPTGSLSGIKDSESQNYVVFDESAIEIEEHIQFSLKEQKERAKTYTERLRETPEFKEFVKQSEKQDDFTSYAPGILKWGKKKLGRGYVDNDMKWYNKGLEVPYELGKKWVSTGKLFKGELTGHEKRNEMSYDFYEGDKLFKLGEAQKQYKEWHKSKQEKFDALAWKWDGKKFPKKDVPTDWRKETEEAGVVYTEIDTKHYDEVESYLQKQGVEQDIIDVYLTMRKTYDWVHVHAQHAMMSVTNDPELVTELRSEISRVHNYLPHNRRGDAHITITKKDKETGHIKTVYDEYFYSRKENLLKREGNQVENRVKQWLKDAIDSGELSGKVSDYRINPRRKVRRTPDEVFNMIDVAALQQILKEAATELETSRVQYEADRLYNKDIVSTKKEALELARKRLRGDLEKGLSKAVSNVLKSRGWAGHAIGRKGIPGHETKDIWGITFEYLTGYAGFVTKMERAKHHVEVLNEVDASLNPMYATCLPIKTQLTGQLTRLGGCFLLNI